MNRTFRIFLYMYFLLFFLVYIQNPVKIAHKAVALIFSGFLAFFPSSLEGGTGRIRFEPASLIWSELPIQNIL